MNEKKRKELLLLVLELSVKKIQQKPLSKEEEEKLESIPKELGLSLEQALEETCQFLK